MSFPPRTLAVAVALVMAGSTVACSTGGVAKTMAVAPEADLGGGAKCSVAGGDSAPFIVEWTASDRARLESAVRRGVVPVRYTGCELEMLSGCVATPRYEYVPLTPKSESVEIRDADELYARFPRGAVKLEGTLERAGALAVEMMIVGRLEAQAYSFQRTQLQGSCNAATHVISGLTVGAFEFHTGARAEVAASVDVERMGAAGAGSSSSTEQLSVDGERAACDAASLEDPTPPQGCGALMRIEVTPLTGPNAVAPISRADQKGFLAPGTPWFKPALAGTIMLPLGFAGMGMLVVGMSNLLDADGFGDEPDNPSLKRQGTALTAVGGVMYGVGIIGGITALAIGGVRRKRAREGRLTLSGGPGGLALHF